MRTWIVVLIATLFSGALHAVTLDSIGRNPAYVATIVTRATKIVDSLAVGSPLTHKHVTHLIANRYFQINDIHEIRDQQLAAFNANPGAHSQESRKTNTEHIMAEKDAALYRTRYAFLSALTIYLNNQQIEKVKDGMTFGVLKVTYRSMLEMIPSLTQEEKKQIMAWLIEAREYAIDAESASSKHHIFGKYKGRINNYLSARGYNLQKERQEWMRRIQPTRPR